MKNDQVQIGLIVACSQNGVIGRDGGLPWHLPDDLKHFMQSTKGHAVIMGRKTFETLKMPGGLGGRLNIVVSGSMPIEDGIDGKVAVVRSLEEGLEVALAADKVMGKGLVWIAGGGDIYRQAMGLANVVVRTRVHCEVDGDVFFDELDSAIWTLERSENHEMDDRHPVGFDFEWWIRKS